MSYHDRYFLGGRLQQKQQVAERAPYANETRVTDPNTGGQKGQKLARFSLIPSEFLWALAEHYGKGASKYADRNWEKGYSWSLCVDAMQRHLHAWLQGESNDPETGSHHLIAVAWHACALFVFERRGLGTDDVRPDTVDVGAVVRKAAAAIKADYLARGWSTPAVDNTPDGRYSS